MHRFLDRLFMILSFGLTDWATSPKMLQFEIRRPRLYRLIVWPLFTLLVSAYAALVTLVTSR
jgi:hypothetical protein